MRKDAPPKKRRQPKETKHKVVVLSKKSDSEHTPPDPAPQARKKRRREPAPASGEPEARSPEAVAEARARRKRRRVVVPLANEPDADVPLSVAKARARRKHQPVVVPLSKAPEAVPISSATAIRPREKRRRFLGWSFVLCVLLPILIGTVYFTSIATDRYAATAGFAVRGVNAGSAIDGIGALTGLASAGSTTSDSYIILKYLKSRDIVERLQADMDLRTAFSAPAIDPLSRMGTDLSIEDVVRYWDGMLRTSFDSNSGIVNLEVQAYSAEHAEQIATLVLHYTDELVNTLSVSARQDSVRFAETEVERAEERLRAALQDIRDFREQESSINPAATAQLDIELVGGLESRLIDLRARIASIEGSLDDNAPSLLALRRQAEALEEQIAARAAEISGDTESEGPEVAAMTGLLATYEALEVEKTFAQQVYQSALTSLEQARAEADRQQRYLAVFTLPAKPEDAVYPKRAQSVLMLIAIVISIWGIGALIVYSVRDHLT